MKWEDDICVLTCHAFLLTFFLAGSNIISVRAVIIVEKIVVE